MKHLVELIFLFISTITFGHCVLEHAEVQALCPVKCTCGVTAQTVVIRSIQVYQNISQN